MLSLTEEQAERIALKVREAGLSITHLELELIDHLCCEAEKQLAEGKTFEELINNLFPASSAQTFLELQEETFMLTDTYYSFMKTSMKITGLISLGLMTSGTLFRILHLPGANIILAIGFILLGLIFIPAAVFLDYNRTEKKLARRIILVAGCAASMGGILFKIMHWQGASILLVSGLFILLAIFLPILVAEKIGNTSSGKEKFIYVLGGIALVLFGASVLFKLMHYPGVPLLMISGSFLLAGVFLPLYVNFVLKGKERSSSVFTFLVILTIYTISMAALVSFRGHTTEIPSSSQQTSIEIN